MDRYKTFKIRRFNWWIGLFQGSINVKNCFILGWKWIHSKMHPETEFTVTILGLVLPIIDQHRCLFGITFYTWAKTKRAGLLNIRILYLPSIEFRIGNGKSWLHIRNENFFKWKVMRRNKKSFKALLSNGS